MYAEYVPPIMGGDTSVSSGNSEDGRIVSTVKVALNAMGAALAADAIATPSTKAEAARPI
jgi:hypothetical protein